MSTANMGSALLRAARKQAQEERQAKIEKLRAAGVTIQTAEEREQDEEELEDLVERARQEDEEIRKREKELAKKEGTYVKDALDDADFVDDGNDDEGNSGSDEDKNSESEAEEDNEDNEEADSSENELIGKAAEESDAEEGSGVETPEEANEQTKRGHQVAQRPTPSRVSRNTRIVVDDEDELLGAEEFEGDEEDEV